MVVEICTILKETLTIPVEDQIYQIIILIIAVSSSLTERNNHSTVDNFGSNNVEITKIGVFFTTVEVILIVLPINKTRVGKTEITDQRIGTNFTTVIP